jgi:hypothetical protein
MQPALVYSCLALAMLLRSSEIELGANGRAHALRLRDAAQSHLHESWNLQWIDLGLAEAAMVLALFETSAHPQHDDTRVEAALILLDKIIEALRLTDIDARDPDTLDHSTGVPTIANPRPPPKQCECTTSRDDGSATWSFPAWDPSGTEAEVKAEETRRLCWSALILVANHTVARAAEQREPLDLFLVNPSNVCHGPVTHSEASYSSSWGATPTAASSACSFLENIINAENTSLRILEKIQYGLSTAAACFFGIVLCASGTSASQPKSAPELRALHT